MKGLVKLPLNELNLNASSNSFMLFWCQLRFYLSNTGYTTRNNFITCSKSNIHLLTKLILGSDCCQIFNYSRFDRRSQTYRFVFIYYLFKKYHGRNWERQWEANVNKSSTVLTSTHSFFPPSKTTNKKIKIVKF